MEINLSHLQKLVDAMPEDCQKAVLKNEQNAAELAALRAENARLDAALADTAAQLTDAVQELAEARAEVGALKKYTYAAMEMQDLLADDNSGIRINGMTSSEASMRKAISISQRMWNARKEIEQRTSGE